MVTVLMGLLLGLGLAEGILRAVYVELPSLDALRRSPYASTPFLAGRSQAIDTSLDCSGFVVPRRSPDAFVGDGDAVLSMWAIGDSMTWGMGVAPEDSYVHRLAARFAAEQGGQVRLRNLAMPGAGFCQIIRQLNTGLRDGTPDVLVMGLFADDLEHRAWLAVDGETIGLPGQIQNRTLRWWARRSYTVNLVWFAIAPRRAGTRRFIDEAGQAAIVQHMRTLERELARDNTRFVVVLLAPVGLSRCPADAPAEDRCHWMATDLTMLAQLLDESGVDYIDLRTLWDDAPDVSLPQEHGMSPAIHPNAAGHARIADAIWSQLRPAP